MNTRIKDPLNVDAMLGLAVLEFKNENYGKYHEVLEKAYKIDKASPLLLLHIAEFFLMRNDLEKALFGDKFRMLIDSSRRESLR